MRILIYDNNINDLNKLASMIKIFPIETIIDKVSDYIDCMQMYDKHNYEKLFIDYTDDIGKKIADEIIKINPKQRIFLINDNCDCMSNKDCITCRQSFNKETIIKPLNQQQLSQIISKNFKCESFKKTQPEFTIEKIKKSVYKEFPYFKLHFDKKRQMFLSEPMPISILVYMVQLFKEHNVEYEVQDTERIKILST